MAVCCKPAIDTEYAVFLAALGRAMDGLGPNFRIEIIKRRNEPVSATVISRQRVVSGGDIDPRFSK